MDITQIDKVSFEQLCDEAVVTAEHHVLLEALQQEIPQLNFELVLSRGGWHRIGGVVDDEYKKITDNLSIWCELECDNDVNVLMDKYLDANYLVTNLAGKTHYFSASYGDKITDFIQFEVEELVEVVDRVLIDLDDFPDSIEEVINPLDYTRLDSIAISKPKYKFRRVTDISNLLESGLLYERITKNLQRFFADWQQSSAAENKPFCHYWILALRDYQDSDNDIRIIAKPVSCYAEKLPSLPPSESLHGTELCNAVNNYDRLLGYNFSWFFIMLSSKGSNYSLAQAVLKDQMGAYDYLTAKDLKVLRHWEEQPYSL